MAKKGKSQIRPDPHHSEKRYPSPDPHQIGEIDADPQHCKLHSAKNIEFLRFFPCRLLDCYRRLFLYLPQGSGRAILFGLLYIRCLRNSSLGRNSRSSKRVPVLRHSWRKARKSCSYRVSNWLSLPTLELSESETILSATENLERP
jgi:hypothetical protein